MPWLEIPPDLIKKHRFFLVTHKIYGQKHVRSICQSKIWVNTIVQSELLYPIDIFYSFEITIKTYGVLRYKKRTGFCLCIYKMVGLRLVFLFES